MTEVGGATQHCQQSPLQWGSLSVPKEAVAKPTLLSACHRYKFVSISKVGKLGFWFTLFHLVVPSTNLKTLPKSIAIIKNRNKPRNITSGK